MRRLGLLLALVGCPQQPTNLIVVVMPITIVGSSIAKDPPSCAASAGSGIGSGSAKSLPAENPKP